MAAFFETLARFVVRFRVPVVALWAVVMIVAIVALPGLGSEVNSDPSLFLSSRARSVAAASLGAPLLGSTATSKITIVAVRAGGPLTSADLAAVAREAKLAQGVSGVNSVKHLKKALAAGTGAISPDGKAVQFDVTVNKAGKDVAGLRRAVDGAGGDVPRAGAPAGLQFHLAGPVASNVANNTSAEQGDQADRAAVDRVHHRAAADRAAVAGRGAGHVRAQRGGAAGRRSGSSPGSARTGCRSPRSPRRC